MLIKKPEYLKFHAHWLSPLVVTSNVEEKNMALSNPNYRVVVMDDEPYKYFQLINGEYALPRTESVIPVLLPPHEAIDAYIEGDYETSNKIYEEYLFTNPNVQHCLNTIFTLLFNNIAVLLFIPQDAEPVWSVINTFINYLYGRYGIVTTTSANSIPCMDPENYDTDLYSVLIDLLYTYDTIPVSEYCLQYPIEYINTMSEQAITKICFKECNLPPGRPGEEYVQFAINYVYSLKQDIINRHLHPTDKMSIAMNLEEIPK
ncbi:MAG: hypothetical protein IJ193_00070 [Bacilli bacterium]|nr:hypothetical protein [Bacilli bacterium]